MMGSAHVVPIDQCPPIKDDPIRCLCHYVNGRELRQCKRLFQKLSWDEIVAIDTARVEDQSRRIPLIYLWINDMCRLHEGRSSTSLPMHLLLTNSQTGKHDRKYYKIFKLFLKHG